MRLHIKTTVTFLFLALLPLILTGTIAYTIAESAIENSLGNGYVQIADETMERVDRSMYEVYQNVQTWSKLDIMQDVITDDFDGNISTYLIGLEREYGYFSSLFALNARGKVVAASQPNLIGSDQRRETFYTKALSGNTYMEDIHFDELNKAWVVTFAFPIKAKFLDNKIVGVLCAMWKADELLKLTQTASFSGRSQYSNPFVLMARRDGIVISTPQTFKDRLFGDNLITLGLKSAALANQGTQGYLVEYTPYLGQSLVGYSYSRGYRDYSGMAWSVLVVQDTRTAFAPIRQLNLAIIGMGTVVALMVVFVSLVVSRRMTKPILGIANVARQVSEGDFTGRTDHRSPDEIGALATTFNQMVHDLKKQRDQLVEKHYVDSIIANMTNSLIVVDLQGVVKALNEASLRMLGYEEEEIVGKPAELIFQQPPLKGYWQQSLLDGNIISNTETTYTSKDGQGIPILLSASVIRNERGDAQGIVCVAQDLTERKKAEETLAEQAIRDSLTGLYNRRYFDSRGRRGINSAWPSFCAISTISNRSTILADTRSGTKDSSSCRSVF